MFYVLPAWKIAGELFTGILAVMGVIAGDDDALVGALGGELDAAGRILALLCALLATGVGAVGGEAALVLAGADRLEHGVWSVRLGVMGASDGGEELVGGRAGVEILGGGRAVSATELLPDEVLGPDKPGCDRFMPAWAA